MFVCDNWKFIGRIVTTIMIIRFNILQNTDIHSQPFRWFFNAYLWKSQRFCLASNEDGNVPFRLSLSLRDVIMLYIYKSLFDQAICSVVEMYIERQRHYYVLLVDHHMHHNLNETRDMKGSKPFINYTIFMETLPQIVYLYLLSKPNTSFQTWQYCLYCWEGDNMIMPVI